MSLREVWPLPVIFIVICIVRGRSKRSGNWRGIGASLWRYCTAPTDSKGCYVTDRGWFSAHQRILHPSGRASRLHKGPRIKHTAVRTGTPLVFLSVIYGLLAAYTLTLAMLAVVALAGCALSVHNVRRWKAERHDKQPLRQLVTKRIGHEPEYLEIERAPKTPLQIKRNGIQLKVIPAKPGRITAVEMGFSPAAQLTGSEHEPLILQSVQERLPFEAPDPAELNFKGRNRVLRYVESEPPPFPVTWEDVLPDLRAAGPKDLVFGIGKRGQVVKTSYSESPHVIIAGASGGGKSNLADYLILQELRRGSLVFNLDPKWTSHLWLQNLPNVISALDTWELHMALAWLGKELLRRQKAAYYSAGGTGRIRGSVGPRIIMVCEELNYGMDPLKNYWREIREKTQPKRSPALAGLAAVSCAGRASDIHEFLMAQMLTVESTGVKDSTVRSNAGIKAMIHPELNGWVAACGKNVPMPPSTDVPGRIQVVTADPPKETQVPYLHLDDEDEEVADRAVKWARDYAVSGTVARIPTGSEGVPRELLPPCVLGRKRLAIEAGEGARTVSHETRQRILITLRQACTDEHGQLDEQKLARLRRASTRSGFATKHGDRNGAGLYDEAELRARADGKVEVYQ